MTKAELIARFLLSTENDGTLDGKKAGKLVIASDAIERRQPGEIEGDVIAVRWDATTVAITRDDPDAQMIASRADLLGITVKWMHA